MSVSTNDLTRNLQERFRSQGFTPVEPAVLADAAIFLDRSGEDIRSRTYIFSGPTGAELVLRPDLTVPTALTYISDFAPNTAQLTYAGPAFRVPRTGEAASAREATHVGFEWFGGSGDASEDIAVSRETIEAAQEAGLKNFNVKVGHVGLFRAVLEAQDMTDAQRLKLRRRFSSNIGMNDLIDALAKPQAAEGTESGGVAAALAALPDEAARKAMVEEVLTLANVQPAGGRSHEDIASRLLRKAETLAAEPLSADVVAMLKEYLSCNGPAAETLERVKQIVAPLGDKVAAPLTSLEGVIASLEGVCDITMSTTFGRSMDYYTGLVFEVRSDAVPEGAIAGGGRYDGLVEELGGPQSCSAIGAMIRPDRLAAAIKA